MQRPTTLTGHGAIGTAPYPGPPVGVRSEFALVIACAFSAGVHAALAPAQLDESFALGLGFIGAAALLLALGLGVYLRRGSAPLALLIALLGIALIAAYAVSRTVGLPLLHPAPEAVDPVGVGTKAVEATAVALSVLLLLNHAAGPRRCEEERRSGWTTIRAISVAVC